MATATLSPAALAEVRSLAQKLYDQCRGSSGPYKSLTSCVRDIRTRLEDIELFDEEGDHAWFQNGTRLVDQIKECKDVLGSLDLALQRNRCSTKKDVDGGEVSGLKNALDAVLRELSVAFGAAAISKASSGIATTNLIDTTVVPNSIHATSEPASSMSEKGPKSSKASSSWSTTGRNAAENGNVSGSKSLHTDFRAEREANPEKEAIDFNSSERLQSTSSTANLTGASALPDWRLPFASPDLLSISIEEASSMIMNGDDDLSIRAGRTLSKPSSFEFLDGKETQNVQTVSGSEERVDSIINKPNLSQVQSTTDVNDHIESQSPNAAPSSGLGITGLYSLPVDGRNGSDMEGRRVRHSLSTLDKVSHLGSTSTSRDPTGRARSVSTGTSSVSSIHLPTQSSEDLEMKRSATSTSDIPLVKVIAPMEDTLPKGVRADEHETETQDREEPQLDRQDREITADGLHIITQNAKDRKIGAKSVPEVADAMEDLRNYVRTAFDAPGQNTTEKSSPPPLPPKRPSRHPRSVGPSPSIIRKRHSARPPKPTRPASYVIVNASPKDNETSDDELYTTSKPSSPTTSKRPSIPPPRESLTPNDTPIEDSASSRTTAQLTDSDQSTGALVEEATAIRLDPSPIKPKPVTISRSYDVESRGNASSASVHVTSSAASPNPERELIQPTPETATMSNSQGNMPSILNRPRPTRKSLVKEPSRWTGNIQTSPTEKEMQPINQKEMVPGTGLEVQSTHAVERPGITGRKSVEGVLSLQSSGSTSPKAPESRIHSNPRSPTLPQLDTDQRATYDPIPTLTERDTRGVFGENGDGNEDELDIERTQHCIYFWNSQKWDQADAYLIGYLERLVERNEIQMARRVRHLLGVCASFRGQWTRAISFFLSVLQAPIKDIQDLDDGDCAAAYWLGDTYALLNLQTESLLSYCIAERSPLFHNPADPNLIECINAEQEAVMLGATRADIKMRWANEAFTRDPSRAESILDASIVSTDTARMLFDFEPRRVGRGNNSRYVLDPSCPRFSALRQLSKLQVTTVSFRQLKISNSSFQPYSSWPMPLDPYFTMKNVLEGRLLLHEHDLLKIFSSNNTAHIRRVGMTPPSCFTCDDLPWLITTIRDCLRTYEMEWSEVANIAGTWFVIRYPYVRDGIATMHFCSIALFKSSFGIKLSSWSGYGAEIFPNDICSARITTRDYEGAKGVSVAVLHEKKERIRKFLDEAAKQRTKGKKKDSLSFMSRLSSDKGPSNVPEPQNLPAQQINLPPSRAPPPIPPRPT